MTHVGGLSRFNVQLFISAQVVISWVCEIGPHVGLCADSRNLSNAPLAHVHAEMSERKSLQRGGWGHGCVLALGQRPFSPGGQAPPRRRLPQWPLPAGLAPRGPVASASAMQPDHRYLLTTTGSRAQTSGLAHAKRPHTPRPGARPGSPGAPARATATHGIRPANPTAGELCLSLTPPHYRTKDARSSAAEEESYHSVTFETKTQKLTHDGDVYAA